jgi:CPA2 family monovalent cation:H+ antiporter-2
VAAYPFFVIGMAAVLVFTKAALITGLARLFGMERNQAIGAGLLLSQGGEFGFVLFAQAQNALLIAPQAASLFSAIVTFSMATTPFLMLFARRLEFARPKDGMDLPKPEDAPRGTAIIVGYGRFGQTVAQMLMGHGFGVVLIDKKPSQIEVSSRFDMRVNYGDGTRIDLLRRSGADEARLIAFCIDDPTLDSRLLEPIAEAFPQAALLVRAFDRRQLLELKDVDLAGVVREVFESAICMGVQAMQALGVPPEEIEEVERQYRQNDEQRMAVQIEHGSLLAAKELMYRPGRQMRLFSRGEREEEA